MNGRGRQSNPPPPKGAGVAIGESTKVDSAGARAPRPEGPTPTPNAKGAGRRSGAPTWKRLDMEHNEIRKLRGAYACDGEMPSERRQRMVTLLESLMEELKADMAWMESIGRR